MQYFKGVVRIHVRNPVDNVQQDLILDHTHVAAIKHHSVCKYNICCIMYMYVHIVTFTFCNTVFLQSFPVKHLNLVYFCHA